jgi:hypothetical protein
MRERGFAADVYYAGKGWRRVAVCTTLAEAARRAAVAYAAPADGDSPSQVRITNRDGSPLRSASGQAARAAFSQVVTMFIYAGAFTATGSLACVG